jgi:hypothetical protein
MTETVEPNVVDVLEPKAQNYVVVLPDSELGEEIVFIQKPLTFFGKMEFFSVLGGAVDKAISEGLSVTDLFEVPEDRNINAESFKEADLFVKAVLKLVKDAPDLLLNLYSVILSVPRNQRDYVKDRLEADLSDEDGVAIFEHFIDQNWEVMGDFFKQKIVPLTSKISSKFQGSVSSKPSKATRQNTQRQSKKS